METKLAAFAVAGDEPIAGSVVVNGDGETFDVGEALEDGDGTIVVTSGSQLERALEGFVGLTGAIVPSGAVAVNAGEETVVEVKASEAAKNKAAELGVDLNEVEGTGADGTIKVSDVEDKAAEAAGDDGAEASEGDES